MSRTPSDETGDQVANPVKKKAVKKKAVKKKAAKKKFLSVDSFKVRQIAVNVIAGDLRLITCPQSPELTLTPLITMGEICPWLSIQCTGAISGALAVVGDIGPDQLTELLASLEPPAGFRNMTLNIVVKPANQKATVDAVKKAQGKR